MSMNNLTIDGEFRYIVQWFNEWSELQRDDFVPILMKYIMGTHINNDDDNDNNVAVTTTPVNMNGLPTDLEFNGRPMSLFQCRIKLFNQWNRRWPTEFKEELQQKISEIDDKIGEKIKLALNQNSLGSLTNGYTSKQQGEQNMEQSKNDGCNDASEGETMVLNDSMTDVLNNETSVDDIETNDDSNIIIENPLFNNTLHNDDNDHFADCDGNNTRHNHEFIEHGKLAEQVVQMQCLQINEEKVEAEKDHEDVTAFVEQQPLPTVTVTVNPVAVTQTITTNAEVPLVV